MFGGLASLVQPSAIGPPPKDVPPPTPVKLPQCKPRQAAPSSRPSSVVRFLQTLHRPTEVTEAHFAALGVNLHADTPADQVVPDPSCLPEASGWDGIDLDEARRRDSTFRKLLCTGKMSPEARVYLDRRNELSIANQAAFRTIRRIKPEMGKKLIQLGNSYEFYRQMELMATFWDDTSLPSPGEDSADDQTSTGFTPHLHPIDADIGQVRDGMNTTESDVRSESGPNSNKPNTPERVTYRTAPGSQMPAEFRHALISAFIKLVAYDFGCTIVPPRVEPRLQIVEPSLPQRNSSQQPEAERPTTAAQRASYFPSGCVFLCRTPTTREAARAGFVEGPIAAVSARNTTSFSTPTESNIDFGRELIAALVTAQHRAREGRVEKRFGEGKWWATEKRWGGGEGGPIGREVEGDAVLGDKDAKGNAAGEPGATLPSPADKSSPQQAANPPAIPFCGPPLTKRPRKTLSVYDRYRMVRLPTSNWDKKAVYEAIGRVQGAGFDDVFVISSLFHHISVLRVRVPDRLLQVLDGGPEDGPEREDSYSEHSWGQLEIWRSQWYDLFRIEERLEAMRLIWGMMEWAMRDTGAGKGIDTGGGAR
ncbi:hypothetical protein F5Y16DRAFT_417780 [Xylariaceae sp. FL0255]|nr:hypothetical protein F5Y16DRAFT_417780 [Xylariaceae sp. FL0255]